MREREWKVEVTRQLRETRAATASNHREVRLEWFVGRAICAFQNAATIRRECFEATP
jgi:hypothetical protein